MTAKEQLREIVEGLTEEEAAIMLELYDEALGDEEFTEEEIEEILRIREEIDRGETIPWEQVKSELGL